MTALPDPLRRRCAPPECVEELIGLALRPGQRVLDLVTGLEGEVISGRRELYLIPPAK